MGAGKLDRRVQFQRAALVDDGFSNAEVFANHGAPIWAGKTDVSDGERYRAGEVAAHISARFMVRYSAFTADLTPKDRLVCNGIVYDISGIKEPADTRNQWREITAAARAD